MSKLDGGGDTAMAGMEGTGETEAREPKTISDAREVVGRHIAEEALAQAHTPDGETRTSADTSASEGSDSDGKEASSPSLASIAVERDRLVFDKWLAAAKICVTLAGAVAGYFLVTHVQQEFSSAKEARESSLARQAFDNGAAFKFMELYFAAGRTLEEREALLDAIEPLAQTDGMKGWAQAERARLETAKAAKTDRENAQRKLQMLEGQQAKYREEGEELKSELDALLAKRAGDKRAVMALEKRVQDAEDREQEARRAAAKAREKAAQATLLLGDSRTEVVLVPATTRLDEEAPCRPDRVGALELAPGELATVKRTAGHIRLSNAVTARDLYGPAGVLGRWSSKSIDGKFKHGALLSSWEGRHARVHPRTQFRADSSTCVRFFVNDLDISNNAGEFVVVLEVRAPRELE